MNILYKISAKLLGTVWMLDIFKNLMLPKLSLLLTVCVLMLADLITGLLKARFLKQRITSEKLRRSVIKFMQYFGSIGLIVVLTNQNKDNQNFVLVMNWTKDGLTILIIYIECLSIFENLYAMDKKTPFAIYVIQPIYRLLTWAVRNNYFTKADEARQKPDKPAKNTDERDKDLGDE